MNLWLALGYGLYHGHLSEWGESLKCFAGDVLNLKILFIFW